MMEKSHDLHDFMNQISEEMASEYVRIQKRASEDPGTAGDQGEENWAKILREWLPKDYHVVTKGRIISQKGETSPQIDILVLYGSYPAKLLDKKLYLAAGVAAAFECKITLKASHIGEAIDNCVKIKSLYQEREGSPYKELHSPIIYGLLAHSHSWKGEQSNPEDNIFRKLKSEDDRLVKHPRYALDLLCVADLGVWQTHKITFMGPRTTPLDWETAMMPIYGVNGAAITSYVSHILSDKRQSKYFRPIGFLISQLTQKLAWEDDSLRGLADYYRLTLSGNGSGEQRIWPGSIYSDNVRLRVENGGMTNGVVWSEWSMFFM